MRRPETIDLEGLLKAPSANAALADARPDHYDAAVDSKLRGRGLTPDVPTYWKVRRDVFRELFPDRAARQDAEVAGILGQVQVGRQLRARRTSS